LILSARTTPDDRIKGLTHGVDDYLVKPFILEELQLRVQRLLTRAAWGRGETSGAEPIVAGGPISFAFGGNRIDFAMAQAEGPGGRVSLTDQEMRLLKLFISNRGQVLSRQRLLEIGWGYSGRMTTRTVDNFIVRFRKYFEDDPKHPRYFKSIRSVGYLFDDGGQADMEDV
jgi:DNA-binding response OmpR family regulator